MPYLQSLIGMSWYNALVHTTRRRPHDDVARRLVARHATEHAEYWLLQHHVDHVDGNPAARGNLLVQHDITDARQVQTRIRSRVVHRYAVHDEVRETRALGIAGADRAARHGDDAIGSDQAIQNVYGSKRGAAHGAGAVREVTVDDRERVLHRYQTIDCDVARLIRRHHLARRQNRCRRLLIDRRRTHRDAVGRGPRGRLHLGRDGARRPHQGQDESREADRRPDALVVHRILLELQGSLVGRMELTVSARQRTGRLRWRRIAHHRVVSDPVDLLYDSNGEAILTDAGFAGVTVPHLELQVLLSRVLDPHPSRSRTWCARTCSTRRGP